MKRIISIAVFVIVYLQNIIAQNDFVWFEGNTPITYSVSGKVDPVVKIALEMFKEDMRLVTGLKPKSSSKGIIRIIQKKNQENQSQDGFEIYIRKGKIFVVGNGGRGTAYGILELSRLAGVSPWVWWGDIVPERKTSLSLPTDYHTRQQPSVEYRGIFINDEDWSIRPWSSKTLEPGVEGRIGVQTYKRIFQLLLRLRGNTIWPAMHEGTIAFFDVEGVKEMADSFSIVLGTSHCEPMMRNNVGEWKKADRGPFNYKTNRQSVQNYWIERLKEVKDRRDNIFTIGMRGIHDSSMEGYSTMQEKFEGLQQVINDQQTLLEEYVGNPKKLTQMFVPYKEVLELYENGLKVPDYVTLMWCDDNYGYITRLSDDAEQQRSGGAGIYYHLSYWGRPHDYLWLTTTQPGLIFNEMSEAYRHHARKIWIANVHDPKVAGYDLELFMDMAWDIHSVSAATVTHHYKEWLCRQFGHDIGNRIFPAMHDFYRLCGERHPEFTGHTQVELDKKKYERGLSPVTTVDWDRLEADQRLKDFEKIKRCVEDNYPYVRKDLQDAYFTAILYPVLATTAMNRKILGDTIESHKAYQEIQQLTARYNEIKEGKWRYLMSAAPRDLPVYRDVRASLSPDKQQPIIVRDAHTFNQATQGAHPIQMLGYSMNAVSLPKEGSLIYSFTVDKDDSYTLFTRLIPTHAIDSGDIRYSISIDNGKPTIYTLKEPFRSEEWKKNVLRGQAIREMTVTLSKGEHTLTIKALDEHIIVDQWSLYLSK